MKIDSILFKFGFYGGIAYALVLTILYYVFDDKITTMGLLGGILWFVTATIVGKFFWKK